MTDTVHLYPGTLNDDGTMTVTSAISSCCRRVLSTGKGTVIAEQSTCAPVTEEKNE